MKHILVRLAREYLVPQVPLLVIQVLELQMEAVDLLPSLSSDGLGLTAVQVGGAVESAQLGDGGKHALLLLEQGSLGLGAQAGAIVCLEHLSEEVEELGGLVASVAGDLEDRAETGLRDDLVDGHCGWSGGVVHVDGADFACGFSYRRRILVLPEAMGGATRSRWVFSRGLDGAYIAAHSSCEQFGVELSA